MLKQKRRESVSFSIERKINLKIGDKNMAEESTDEIITFGNLLQKQMLIAGASTAEVF